MDTYPPVVQAALAKMDESQRLTFEAEYKRRAKSVAPLIVLAILFPIQMFLLGKTVMGIVFWLTLGGFGVWWIIEIFLTPKRLAEFNDELATNIARDLKIMA